VAISSGADASGGRCLDHLLVGDTRVGDDVRLQEQQGRQLAQAQLAAGGYVPGIPGR